MCSQAPGVVFPKETTDGEGQRWIWPTRSVAGDLREVGSCRGIPMTYCHYSCQSWAPGTRGQWTSCAARHVLREPKHEAPKTRLEVRAVPTLTRLVVVGVLALVPAPGYVTS